MLCSSHDKSHITVLVSNQDKLKVSNLPDITMPYCLTSPSDNSQLNNIVNIEYPETLLKN